ncbi:SDR family NAD(P)-dependent oxidoreductase [Saccharopolyspora spinosa]|uniref:3-oxoacyl-[acyl-carrier protein] reductase n=1 Tax=Saccharopolyspora spinosa TaxID=60894 RepID=A0A2N3XXZ5_SACSN|nr:SDR family NAD(P)-dependent oxidoreductase [Saccharopolyspora spinosa]PKW15546.1 3-oxoacyl-[acyl-carrier protein] reductase [Saccharopolyspora spinosa]
MSHTSSEGHDGFARLDGRTVVVTGAAGGIGSATSDVLVRAGAQVVLAHGPGEADAHAAAQLVATLGEDRACAVAVDVLDEGSVTDLFEAAYARFGRIDALVTAAGVMEQVPFADLGPDVWQHTIGINLTGTYLCVRAALPYLQQTGQASVVTVSSQLAYTGATDVAAYTASKAGILGLTRALAHELGPRIRVNAVAPGPIDTPMTRPHATAEWTERKTSRMVFDRFGTADEVASAIRFLVSEAASFVTGQTINANGGGVMP